MKNGITVSLMAILILMQFSLLAQNLTKEQTVEYINAKLHISDPVFNEFTLGDNGEAVIKWVTRDVYTEYRFNIREIEIELKLSEDGDNYIEFTCVGGTNNCLQRAWRKNTSQVGDDVSYAYHRDLTILSIAGYDNITSVKNAFKYLKILSEKDNQEKSSEKKDPFLY